MIALQLAFSHFAWTPVSSFDPVARAVSIIYVKEVNITYHSTGAVSNGGKRSIYWNYDTHMLWVHFRGTAHLFGLGSPIGVRLGSGLGTVFLIRICETFFGLFSASVLWKKGGKVKIKEIKTTQVNGIPLYSEYYLQNKYSSLVCHLLSAWIKASSSIE